MDGSANGLAMKQIELKLMRWDSQWEIDGSPCQTLTLDFGNMPCSVYSIEAQALSANTVWTQTLQLCSTAWWRGHIPTEAQWVFAYQDNLL